MMAFYLPGIKKRHRKNSLPSKEFIKSARLHTPCYSYLNLTGDFCMSSKASTDMLSRAALVLRVADSTHL